MNLKKTGALVCAAAVLTLGGAYGAQAASSSSAPATVASAPVQHHVKYSDEDIVGLLVFGKGKAADEHKDLAEKIRSHRGSDNDKVTLEQIAQFTNELRKIDPELHDKVTVPVQINDPFQAKAGMERLADDIKALVAKSKGNVKNPKVASGVVWHDANVLIELNALGFINAVGYANVAGATEAVVALVVVPSAVSYGFDMQKSNGLDADDMVSAVSSAL
ncbi:sporulation delaying protein family toxin [Streptomyces luteireticuli]|uniref:Sporulation delaying protein family toxin n=1 Tax=Streptomyces luteireticuli TaxID=173858 RepID=A0ABN0YB33_9ACTN